MQIDAILTGLIVSAITAIATSIVSAKIHAVQIKHLEEGLNELKHEVKDVRERIHKWAPIIGWADQRRRFKDWEGDSHEDC